MGKTEHQEITLPYDMDAEQATLAGILHDPDQLESLRLKPGDFHHAMHKDIFRAMQSLQRQAGCRQDDMALRVAQGKPWLGRYVTQGPVVYLALEEQKW